MRQFNNLYQRKQRIRSFTVLMGIFFTIVLCSCITTKTSIIMTGTARAAINPNEVKIYADPPAKYETIGLIEASREIGSSRQATQDIVISELKSQAAKMGANGVILGGTGSQSNGGVVVGSVIVASEVIATQGRAIYVIQE